MPGLAALNDAAAAAAVVSGGGLPLRFVAESPGSAGYEAQIYSTGRVSTRGGNWHDLFNACIWLTFPRSKAALNRRHVDALGGPGLAPAPQRGALRDALTQFDECGVLVVGRDATLWQAIRDHRWTEVFVTRRAEVRAGLAFHVFGHASHDALRAPFVGLCGKALYLNLPAATPLPQVDAALATWLATAQPVPRDWQPLPLLGIPGATPDNEVADYYADRRQFRPPRSQPASAASISAKE